MKKITLGNYAVDTYYPRVVAAVESTLRSAGSVAPVDVFMAMGLLEKQHVDDWRKGRIPYLERVIKCNLAKAGRILRILRFHAHDLNLRPIATTYRRRARGGKIPLRFSKSGDRNIEEAYSRHFAKPEGRAMGAGPEMSTAVARGDRPTGSPKNRALRV
jgi:hypothetical protein